MVSGSAAASPPIRICCAVLGARRRTLSARRRHAGARPPLCRPQRARVRRNARREHGARAGGDHRRLGAGARVADFGAQSGSSTTSTCVLFGERDRAGPPPAEIDRWAGRASATRCQRGRGGRGARTCARRVAEAADVAVRVALPEALSAGGDADAAPVLPDRARRCRAPTEPARGTACPRSRRQPRQAAVDDRRTSRGAGRTPLLAPDRAGRVCRALSGPRPRDRRRPDEEWRDPDLRQRGCARVSRTCRMVARRRSEMERAQQQGDRRRAPCDAGAIGKSPSEGDGAGSEIAGPSSVHESRNAAQRVLARRRRHYR